MGRDENRAYLEAIRSRYRHAGRAGKSKILDEFCAVCGYQRKYAIRLLGTVPKQSAGVQVANFNIANLGFWKRCAVSGLPPTRCAASDWSPRSRCGCLTTRRSTECLPRIRSRLLSASATRPGTLLNSQLPIRTEHWDLTQPGFVEADTVAHGGNSLAGD